MNWAERRRLTYVTIVLMILGMIGFLIFQRFNNTPPTCFDNRKNGTETGVDCGGSCMLYCANDLAAPKTRWVRAFQITSTMAHAVAYIEHNNATAAAPVIGYTFKLYDDKNSVVAERSGTTFLGPLGKTAIVETLIPTTNVPIARTSITFTEPIQWQKIPTAFATTTIKTDRTLIESYSYSTTQNGTRLSVTLENTSRYIFNNLDAVAILYDKDDNVVTASKMVVPLLPALDTKVVTFTWPFLLPSVVRVEVVPRFNPFTAQLL